MSIHQKILNKHKVQNNEQSNTMDSQVSQGPQFMNSQYSQSHYNQMNSNMAFQNMALLQTQLDQLREKNCDQRYVQMTTEVFPASRQLIDQACVPLGCQIQPFANFTDLENKVSRFGKHSIIRCESCRAYINVFSQIRNNYQSWECNFCGKIGTIPEYYKDIVIDNINQNEQNQQFLETNYISRQELINGAFEFTANEDYSQRPPQSPLFFFMIDTTDSEYIRYLSLAVKEMVQSEIIIGNQRTQIGVISYNQNGIHLYVYNGNKFNMIVIPDNDDSINTILPIADDLLLNISEHKEQIIQLMDLLPTIWTEQNVQKELTQKTNSFFGKCLKLSFEICKNIGAKLIIFQNDETIINDICMKDNKSVNDKSPIELNKVNNNTINKMCLEYQHYHFSVNLFIFQSKQFKNCLALSELTKYLNGQVKYYEKDQNLFQCLYYDLVSILTKNYTWESVFRIRISKGWFLKSIYGNYSIKTGDLLSLSNLDEDQTLTYEFQMGQDLPVSTNFSVQTALLYTTSDGKRRIRVFNYSVPLSSNLEHIHWFMNHQSLTTYILKQSLFQFYKMEVKDVRQKIIETLQGICKKNRQIQYPQNMTNNINELVIDCLAILKSSIFVNTYDKKTVQTDIDNCNRTQLNQMNYPQLIDYFRPKLYRIDSFDDDNSCVFDEDTNQFIYPQSLALTIDSLSSEGIYLMDQGDRIVILIGQQIKDDVLHKFIGQTTYSQIQQNLVEDILFFDNKDVNVQKAYDLVNEIKISKINKNCPVYIIKETDTNWVSLKFFNYLIMDSNQNQQYSVGYNQFVKQMI